MRNSEGNGLGGSGGLGLQAIKCVGAALGCFCALS